MLFMSRGALASVDRWFTKYGKNAILICRLLPFVSFDYISYAAGITGMSFLDFFIWTGIGQLPATIVYSYVGSTLTGEIYTVFMAMIMMFIIAGVVWFFALVWKSRHKELMDESNETADAEAATNGKSAIEVNAEGKFNMRKKAKPNQSRAEADVVSAQPIEEEAISSGSNSVKESDESVKENVSDSFVTKESETSVEE